MADLKKTNWDDLNIILMMVRHGSLANAARALGVNYTTISRRITQAEKRYETCFFERLPSGYVPTADAEIAARYAAQMEQSCLDFGRELQGATKEISGPLTLTAPQLLISHHLHALCAEFMACHPEVDLNISAEDSIVNLNRREADLAFRISNNPGDNLKGRRLTAQVVAAFASQEYAEKYRRNTEMVIDWIGFSFWKNLLAPPIPTGEKHRVRLRFDTMISVVGAVQAGQGVARMPRFLGRGSGLVEMPVMAPETYADLWMVAHRDVWNFANVKAFRELAAPWFRARRHMFV